MNGNYPKIHIKVFHYLNFSKSFVQLPISTIKLCPKKRSHMIEDSSKYQDKSERESSLFQSIIHGNFVQTVKSELRQTGPILRGRTLPWSFLPPLSTGVNV